MQKLNLAVLKKREVEMTEKEMNKVRSGEIACECEVECGGHSAPLVAVFDAAKLNENCPCASIWVIYGLAWG